MTDHINNAINFSLQEGLTIKESIAGILAYTQYHNKLSAVFKHYDQKYQEHSIHRKIHPRIAMILSSI
jgi:hypothetical protein